MRNGYCPKCTTNVTTKRTDFKLLVAFLLAFTGIGLIIYILYHIDKKKNRCIYCDTICQAPLIDNQSNSNNQLNSNNQSNSNNQLTTDNQLPKYQLQNLEEKEKTSFCHDCGTKMPGRNGIQYCSFCGTSVAQ